MCNLDTYNFFKKIVQITISSVVVESHTAFKSQNPIAYVIMQFFPRNIIRRGKIEKQKYESKLVNFIKYSS